MSEEAQREVIIKLSLFGWSLLLEELRFCMQVVNRDDENTCLLYESIASQLYGQKVEVVRRKKKEPEPEPIKIRKFLGIF